MAKKILADTCLRSGLGKHNYIVNDMWVWELEESKAKRILLIEEMINMR